MKRYQTGLDGEEKAEKALTAKGMRCLARRYRGADGEIDLIMQDGAMIVFVEVKDRPLGRAGTGLMAITPAKQRRIAHAAMHYLAATQQTDRQARFDVVELTADGLLHIPNAFWPAS
ncbi:MAG: YraN family protein [bacterium]|nr:YraN family protein [bacterium]